jgi:hypothetical protein
MTQLTSSIPISFGTLGVLQRQVRQLLNGWPVPEEANDRPAAFCLANDHIGVLPSQLHCRSWLLVEPRFQTPALVLAAEGARTAAYVVVSLTERATLATLVEAFQDGSIELVVAGPGGATSHWLQFTTDDASQLEGVIQEYLDLCLPHDPGWLFEFSSAVPRLPALCQHLNTALAECERQTIILLQGTADNHLRAVRTALKRSTG